MEQNATYLCIAKQILMTECVTVQLVWTVTHFQTHSSPLAMEILLTSMVPSVTNMLSASPGFS